MNKFKMIGFAMLMAVMFLCMMSGAVAMQNPPGKNKIEICHKPGTSAEKTMNIPPTAWEEEGHSTHGDYIGECRPQEEPTTVVVPTIVGPPPTPLQATATSEPVVIQPTATNVPQEIPPVEVPTNIPVEQPVTIQVSPTITPTIVWEFTPPDPAETCDLCNAQESALEADARLKNTVADFIDMIIDGWIPEVIKFWKE